MRNLYDLNQSGVLEVGDSDVADASFFKACKMCLSLLKLNDIDLVTSIVRFNQ